MAQNIVQGIGKEEKPVLVYDKNHDGGKIRCIGGWSLADAVKGKIKPATLSEWRKKPLSREFVPIPTDIDIETEFKEFIDDANAMKKATDNLVNMFITGRNPQTAMHLAYHFMNKNGIAKPETITPQEAEWIDAASQGAIIFADKYEGEAWKYDINSAYPSIYSSPSFNIPVKQGEFLYIDEKEFDELDYYKFGIYRCTVDYPDESPKWKKLFRLNFNHMYTHHDLMQAKKLGLNITLTTNVEHNFLYWSKEKLVRGHKMFGEFVELLYKLKGQPETKRRAKQLLNCLWGSLCQDNCMTAHITADDEEFELMEGRELLDITPDAKGGYRIRFYKKDCRYETNFARMKPFLLARGRNKIGDLIAPHVKYVKRCHTDSIVSCVELPFKHSDKIGELKFEGYSDECKIVNANKMLGDFE